MAGENETLQGGAGTDTVVGAAVDGKPTEGQAELKLVADQNGTTETKTEEEDRTPTLADIVGRLEALEAGRAEVEKTLTELTDTHTALTVVASVDPQSVSTITDAIKLFDDIKTLLPRLTCIEQKMKHFF